VPNREAVLEVLDAGVLAHVAFVVDHRAVVAPMIYGRAGDDLYLHASVASRLGRALRRDRAPRHAEVNVTIVDGLVLARSAFNHSMNYRSATIEGPAGLVADPAEMLEALRIISDHLMPGRWRHMRGPNEKEMVMTAVIRIPIERGTVRARSGPPIDEPEDLEWPVWAGVVPVRLGSGEPIPAPGAVSESGYPRRLGGELGR
jgi:uncharacterized protein